MISTSNRLNHRSGRHLGIWITLLIAALLPTPSSATKKPNIVLVTLESTRADRMGFLGAKNATPNLSALARQSIIFERAYAQAPLTVVSHATILSGTYPQTHAASELGNSLAPGLPYLSDLLHANGYRTAAFVGSILLDPRDGFAPGFDRGFDVYDAGFHPVQSGDKKTGSVERSSAQVVARATAWLSRNNKTPFFIWLHLNDPATGSPYDRKVTAADAALGRLLSTLRYAKLYNDSIIVVTADHGESLGAHGEDAHGIFLYDDTIHVPLLVKLPANQLAGKRVHGCVRLVDVAPTILEAAAIPVPSQMQGQSLLRIAKTNPGADQPVYSRSDFPQQAFGWSVLESWRSGKYLYIRAPKPEVYDLSADPTAAHNLAPNSKAILDTMAAQLTAFDSHFGNTSKPASSGLSSTEMEKLASLGYVGLQKPASAADTSVAGTDPKDAISIANKTLAAMRALEVGGLEKAVASFREIVARQPNTYLTQFGLGTALSRQQRYKDAIPHLHKAIELHPESARAQYEMALCLMRTGDFKTAAVHLEIATSRVPSFAAAHSLLAEIYEHLGRQQEAQRERAAAARDN
jgi:choline-sulfatase